jgi:MFS family permease
MTIPHPSRPTSISAMRGWRAFRHRNYRLFFAGQLISLVGTWMQTVAQSWLVLSLTGDPLALGLVAAAQFGPVLVLGLFGGLIADGLPKRRTLIATQVSAMTLALILGVLTATNLVTVPIVFVLAFLLGITNAIDMPTRQAFVIEMVGREDVGNAVALNSAMFNTARIVGPAVAGLTVEAFSISIAFFLNGLSFLAVIASYFLMDESKFHARPRMPRPTSLREVGANLAEGLSYVRRTEIVLLATIVIGLVSTFAMNFNVLIPPFARDVLHTDAGGFGFLMAASGIGSLCAALGIAFAGRTTSWVIAGGSIVLGLAEILVGATTSYAIALVGMFAAGAGAIAMAATVNTTMQLAVPDALRGRVMSVYTTVFAGSTPIGGPLIGAVAATFGPAFGLAAGGVVAAATGVGAAVWVARIKRRLGRSILLPTDVVVESGGASPADAGRNPVSPPATGGWGAPIASRTSISSRDAVRREPVRPPASTKGR